MSLNSGALLSGRYRLLRVLAAGGMGQVWEADDTTLDRHVAVKVLKPEFSSDAEFVERFRAEATTTARISHHGVAAVYDYGQINDPSSGTPLSYLVMELVRGEPLSDVLTREGQVPLRHTLDMLEQTGRALQSAHAIGLVHRDVKPGNILITPSGQVKLTDFGIAKSMGSAAVTQTGMVVGTAQYIAPEQAMGRDASPAGDVYSLGVVGYECLAGRRPFVADSPVSIAMMHVNDAPPPLPDDVPEPVRRLLGYALAKDPSHRYPDGAAFAAAVADVRAGREPTPPAGPATDATTVFGTETLRAQQPAATTPAPSTRAYTRLDRPAAPATSRPHAVAPAPRRQGSVAAPPPRRRGGCGLWAVLGLLALLVVLIGVLVAVTNPNLLGGGGSTTTPTTARPAPTPTQTTRPSTPEYSTPSSTPTPTPSSTPRRSTSSSTPTPTPTIPTSIDISGLIESITSEFLPAPNGRGNGGDYGNGRGNGGG